MTEADVFQHLIEDSADEDDLQLSNFSKKGLLAQCQLKITQNAVMKHLRQMITLEVHSVSASANPSSNYWKYSEGENACFEAKVKKFQSSQKLGQVG